MGESLLAEVSYFQAATEGEDAGHGEVTLPVRRAEPVVCDRPARVCPRRTTVLVADENALVREGLRSVLATAGIAVVAEAATGGGVVRDALEHRPDVLVLGAVPEQSRLVRELSRAAPDIGVLMVNAAEDEHAVLAALQAGVRGYLELAAGRDDIVRAVRAVAAGWVIFSPEILGLLTNTVGFETQRPFPELTSREYQVLDLIAAGQLNSAIARQLRLAPKTISNHISRIFVKLGVPDRAKAIVLAREAGLGRDSR
ncbi:response regulator transcription factor [Nocardia sp. NPDC051832]|uniref:response regulator transcription factor n=1 Tax=Nocardia sp. NPDC051832 TaxID=3155673 RepID=UPI00341776CF